MLHIIIMAIVPTFLIMGCGALSTKLKNFPSDTDTALNDFVFYFAMPFLLFISMATTPIDEILNWHFIFVYFLAALIPFIIALLWLWRSNSPPKSIVLALGISSPNVAYMGIPVLTTLLGGQVLIPITLATVMFCLFMAIGVVIIEISKPDTSLLHVIRNGMLSLIKNPLIVAPVLGILVSIFHIQIPQVFAHICNVVGATAGPCALFAIGETLMRRKAQFEIKFLSIALLLKLILQPMLVLIILYFIPMNPFWSASTFILTGLPTLMICYILAQQFNAGLNEAASLILISTLGSF